jgi:hypothetical protein
MGGTAILRDPEGGATIGRTDYTTWTRLDDLTWRVTVPDLVQDWSASAWHVADEDANVQSYQCGNDGVCEAVDPAV